MSFHYNRVELNIKNKFGSLDFEKIVEDSYGAKEDPLMVGVTELFGEHFG